MARIRVPSHFFVFVVVEHHFRGERHVLLVREAKHGQHWYCPAGGMEPGETIAAGAVRETMEEAGVLVEPTGLLRVEQQWFPNAHGGNGESGLSSWWRFVLRARVVGDPTPKSFADEHSLEARWVRPLAIAQLSLRHREVIDLVDLALGATPSVPLVPLVA